MKANEAAMGLAAVGGSDRHPDLPDYRTVIVSLFGDTKKDRQTALDLHHQVRVNVAKGVA